MTNNENFVNNILTKPQTFLNHIAGKKPIQETLLRTFAKYNCDLVDVDTSNIKDMSRMFDRATFFNQDISQWDTSKVVDMSWMFRKATSFNQDISGWDTSKVMNMSWMFSKATSFNQDTSQWNTSNVIAIYGMLDDGMPNGATSMEEVHKPTFTSKEQQ